MTTHLVHQGSLLTARRAVRPGAGRLVFFGWVPRTRQAAESLTGLSMNREDVLFCFFSQAQNDEPFRIFFFFWRGRGEKVDNFQGILRETQPNSGRLCCFVDGKFQDCLRAEAWISVHTRLFSRQKCQLIIKMPTRTHHANSNIYCWSMFKHKWLHTSMIYNDPIDVLRLNIALNRYKQRISYWNPTRKTKVLMKSKCPTDPGMS